MSIIESLISTYHIKVYSDNLSNIATIAKTATVFRNSAPKLLSHTYIEGLLPFGCISNNYNPSRTIYKYKVGHHRTIS